MLSRIFGRGAERVIDYPSEPEDNRATLPYTMNWVVEDNVVFIKSVPWEKMPEVTEKLLDEGEVTYEEAVLFPALRNLSANGYSVQGIEAVREEDNINTLIGHIVTVGRRISLSK